MEQNYLHHEITVDELFSGLESVSSENFDKERDKTLFVWEEEGSLAYRELPAF